MSDTNWISAILTAARPQAVAALLRQFRDLDTAEEAFQEACLRALKAWPKNGPPRDAAAWLIMVGKNAAIDTVRRQGRLQVLPPEELISDLADAETAIADRIDEADYRDDILRLLFVCCHPDLPSTQQIALALRIVSGLSVKQIARAFLVGEAAMEQRITRAKARVAAAHVPFETPGAVERSQRLGVVAAMIYLVFNEGYTTNVAEQGTRAALCEEAIRLSRLLLGLYPAEPEIMGLAALVMLQHARAPARFDADGHVVLLDDQDRALWDRRLTAEGLALIGKAVRHGRPGPYQVQAAIAALHARVNRAEDTDWAEIDLLYGTLERMQPSPVISLNRAVADVQSALGTINVLFNHAGTIIIKPFLETTEQEWDWLTDVNVKSMYLMTKAVLPQMIAAGGGSIVCTSSISAIAATPMEVAYCTTKGACHQFARAIAAAGSRYLPPSENESDVMLRMPKIRGREFSVIWLCSRCWRCSPHPSRGTAPCRAPPSPPARSSAPPKSPIPPPPSLAVATAARSGCHAPSRWFRRKSTACTPSLAATRDVGASKPTPPPRSAGIVRQSTSRTPTPAHAR